MLRHKKNRRPALSAHGDQDRFPRAVYGGHGLSEQQLNALAAAGISSGAFDDPIML
jgi:hypothetical protein